MDEGDYAAAAEQRDRDRALAARKPEPQLLAAIGGCYNCSAIVPPGVRWCDSDCRTDWEHRQARSGRCA